MDQDDEVDDSTTDSQGCGASGSSRMPREVTNEDDEADSTTTAHGEVIK